MVQRRSEKTDEVRPILTQDPARDDGYKIKEIDDKVLPCDDISG